MTPAQLRHEAIAVLRRLDKASQWAVHRLLIKLAVVGVFAGVVVRRPLGESILMLVSVNVLTSVAIAILYRENAYDRSLNHWDEAMAFTGLCALAHALKAAVGAG